MTAPTMAPLEMPRQSEERFCISCGSKIGPAAKFCTKCGSAQA
jgi:ribosomal protein L40E